MSLSQAHRVAGVAIDREAREKDDYYPTPPTAVKALLRVEKFTGAIWEPACGEGAISNVFTAEGHEVISTDLVDRGFGIPRVDFLMEYKALAPNIVTNPPFKMVEPFMRKATELARGKVALLLRLACLEGKSRGIFYEFCPPSRVWVFSERLQFKRPGWEDTGAGGMLAFMWVVWETGYAGDPVLGWL